MDPLSISTKAGEGDAVVFKSDYQDPYDIYQKDKARRDALLAKQKADLLKTQQLRAKDLEDLNKFAVEGHISYLDQEGQMKNAMIEKASKALVKSNGTADVYKEVYPELTELQKFRNIAQQTQSWASQIAQDINKDPNKLDPKSIDDAKAFLKLKPIEQKDYLLKNGGFPELKHKEEFQDYNKAIYELSEKTGKIKGGDTKTDAAGNITSYTTEEVAIANNELKADFFVKAGLNPQNTDPRAAKLIIDTKTLLENDPLFKILPPEQQAEQIYEKSKEYVIKGFEANQDRINRSRVSRAPKIAASEKVIDILPEAGGKVNVGIGGTGEVETVGTGKAEVKRWRFPKTIPIQANPEVIFDINTGQSMQGFGDQQMTASEVVETAVITDKNGNKYIIPENKLEEFKKKAPKMKGVTYEKFASVMTKNEDGDVVKGYIPYEPISGQIKEQKINIIDKGSNKNKISLNDAKRANPGMSDAELIKGYAKHGYIVE